MSLDHSKQCMHVGSLGVMGRDWDLDFRSQGCRFNPDPYKSLPPSMAEVPLSKELDHNQYLIISVNIFGQWCQLITIKE